MTEIMVANPAGVHSSNRLFEWVMAVMMLSMAVALGFPGDSLNLGTLRHLEAAGITETMLGSYLGMVGAMRAVALYANGKLHPQGPRLRALGALLGALVWSQFALILFLESLRTGVVIFGLPLFACLGLGEFGSCYRATQDAGRRRGGT